MFLRAEMEQDLFVPQAIPYGIGVPADQAIQKIHVLSQPLPQPQQQDPPLLPHLSLLPDVMLAALAQQLVLDG